MWPEGLRGVPTSNEARPSTAGAEPPLLARSEGEVRILPEDCRGHKGLVLARAEP